MNLKLPNYILKPILAFCRPDVDAPHRSIFNYFHRSFGLAIFILASKRILYIKGVRILQCFRRCFKFHALPYRAIFGNGLHRSESLER